MPDALRTLIVRVPIQAGVLHDLARWLVQTTPLACASLRVLVVSILNPQCALEALHSLYAATARRARLGYPLQRLFVCSPAHSGPDYSVRNHHGVEWVTFSSSDVGAPCRDGAQSAGFSGGDATQVLASQPREEPLSLSEKYEGVWEACATQGLVEVEERTSMRHWHQNSCLWWF
ncbi:hypothetical protein TRAPUB_5749 [Trametes pubescens]|uniref:Uncharacterized protein n=1 Tax=Trametes pubescens TaxID=154538 RepID=A0A1M2V7Q2_TRAPU|nr:hypothetical protein TRAPUB_5749 [Trametes pubescens]